MKKILFPLLLLVSAHVLADKAEQPEASDQRTYVGVGPYIQSQPYRDADPVVVPTPVVFFDNRLFYVRWTRVGMYVYGGDNWGVSLTAQPRPYGYEADDADILQGMEERKNSWEAGFAIGGKNELGFAELTWFNDILGHSNGSLARLELGKVISSGRWTLVPSLYLIGFSGRFNDYYYGVEPDEATAVRPAYSAKAGINLALQSFLMVDLSESWHLQANLRLDYLDDTISDSPIVEDDWMVSGMLAIAYSFQ